MIRNLLRPHRRPPTPPRLTGPAQTFREHYLALARVITQWCEHQGPSSRQTIGLTSYQPRAGNSSAAFNLAQVLAQQGRDPILLVQVDPGFSLAHRALKSVGSPGFSDVVSGAAAFESVVKPTSLNQLHVIGPGHRSTHDAIGWKLELVSNFFDDARTGYALTIVDLPKATPLTPCYSIAKFLDGLALVVDAGDVNFDEISRLRAKLTQAQCELIGLILNKHH